MSFPSGASRSSEPCALGKPSFTISGDPQDLPTKGPTEC
jgi:hypothetical protein